MAGFYDDPVFREQKQFHATKAADRKALFLKRLGISDDSAKRWADEAGLALGKELSTTARGSGVLKKRIQGSRARR